MENTPILWRRTDTPGHEAARLRETNTGSSLAGTAIFIHESQPVRLDYMIALDTTWRTRSAMVVGWIGSRELHISIETEQGLWAMNGEIIDGLRDCVDIDLNFSPSTNLLPI